MSAREVPLLFLDLDGTVREGKDDALGRFVNGPGDVRVFPESREQIRRWRRSGGRVVGITNQGGIALGLVTEDAVDEAIAETRRQVQFPFDEVMVCPHHPDAKTPEDAHCWCRKPSPGLVYVAVQELMLEHDEECYPLGLALMVGDRPEDEECARRAGVAFQWAADWRAEARS